jgi:hypothetical protein
MGAPLIAKPAGARERRRSDRVDVGASAGIVRLRLPPGREAVLLNLSRSGACVETSSALIPGRPLDVLVSLPGWNWRGRATVMRCRVSALVIDHGVRYEAAVQFDLPLDPDGPERLLEAAHKAGGDGYAIPTQAADGVSTWAVRTHSEPAQIREEAERP